VLIYDGDGTYLQGHLPSVRIRNMDPNDPSGDAIEYDGGDGGLYYGDSPAVYYTVAQVCFVSDEDPNSVNCP
jgi:hypothetical protein